MLNIQDMIIKEDQIEKTHKGREKQIIDGLKDELKDLHPGFALKLNKTFGNVPKNERNKVSAIIRKHWYLTRKDKPSIYYSAEGIPQVSIRKQ